MNKRRKAVLAILLVVCLSSFALAACGCDNDNEEKNPKSVQIEVYHPQIDGKIVYGMGYWMKYDGNPKVFDIKIYSIDEKKYITNYDLVRNDLNSLIVVTIYKNDETNSTRIDINNKNSWPTEVGKYKIAVDFNGYVVKKEDLDPNYKTTRSTVFDLFIEEEIRNE